MPVAPLSLPRYSAAPMRRSWRRRRCASTASSLPSVVGVAGWPWVRLSSGTAACSRAMSASWSASAVAAGSHTCSTAPRTMSAYDRLLTSSLVHAKWTSSPTPGSTVSAPSDSGAVASRRLTKYSTALTSCTVSRSIAPSSAISSPPNAAGICRRYATSASDSCGAPGTTGRTAFSSTACTPLHSVISHSTSTWMRSRLSAASLRWSTSGATAPR
ncbi:hypothetical protein BJF88_08570 [Cellulosimicrobium sp. CUA-896]|nr:hypothetical protein BJF88_08570 [Cellulosimicrobium sp. CUA-896]